MAHDDRPNILFIMSDEHDPAVTGCYGDPLVRTPHLDRLASEGVTFDAAYCNSPLCVPSRLSFTALQYVSRCAAWSNDCRLPSADYPSLPNALRTAGYRPVLIGKQHYVREHDYGFDVFGPQNGIDRTSRATGRGTRRPAHDTTVTQPGAWLNRAKDFRVGDRSSILDHDRGVTDHAIRWLEQYGRDASPFFLFVGYIAPHFPITVPEPFAARYLGRTPDPIGRPGWSPVDESRLPLNYRHLRAGFANAAADPAVERRGRDLYWGLTDWFDDQLGRLLDALDRSPLADRTVVVYTSDHGENKADHGLWWKNCMFEHAARVPLIVRWPRRFPAGARVARPCSLLDAGQTVLDLAGARPFEGMTGRSLLPWLDRPDRAAHSHAGPDAAVSEYFGHNIASGFVMIRKGDWKYVYHTAPDPDHGPQRELYDLSTDPTETHNLAADPVHDARCRDLHDQLCRTIAADPDEVELRCRHDYARGYDAR